MQTPSSHTFSKDGKQIYGSVEYIIAKKMSAPNIIFTRIYPQQKYHNQPKNFKSIK